MKFQDLKIVMMSLASTVAMQVAVSCADNDYDLSKEIDTSLNIDGTISLPLGTTEFIHIGEFLDLDTTNGMIEVDENGNYSLIIVSDADPVILSYDVPEINLGKVEGAPATVLFDIPDAIVNSGIPVGSINWETEPFKSLRYINANITRSHSEMEIAIDSDLPKEIKGIRTISLNSLSTLQFSIPGSGALTIKKGFKVIFPDFITIEKCDNDNFWTVQNGNSIVFTENHKISGSTGNRTDLSVYIKSIDLSDNSTVSNGKVTINDVTYAEGEISIDLKDFESFASQYSLKLQSSIQDLIIQNAEVLLDIEIPTNDIHINVGNDLQESFPGEFVLDVYNPVIQLNLDNGTPLSFNMNATIESIKNSQTSVVVTIPAIGINANSRENIFVSRRGNVAGNAGKDVVVPELSDLIKNIPDELVFKNIQVSSNLNEYIDLSFPRKFDCNLSYNVYAPFSLGKDFSLSYDYDITGLNGLFDSEDYNVEISEAELKFDMENTIPLELGLKASAVDDSGNELAGIKIDVDVTVAAGTLSQGDFVASTTSVPLKISVINQDELSRFSGISLHISSRSNADSEGICLNSNQGIRLRNMSLKFTGGLDFEL